MNSEFICSRNCRREALLFLQGSPTRNVTEQAWDPRDTAVIFVTLVTVVTQVTELQHTTDRGGGHTLYTATQTPIRLHSSPSKHLVYYFMIILTTLDKNTQFLFPFRYVNLCTVWSHDSECVVCATKTKLNYALLMAIRISGMTMMNKGTRGNWMCQVENQPSPYNMLQIPAQLSSVIVF